jgi:tetratricopeptide (TPR) repeat protein
LLDEAVKKFPRDLAAREARARLLAGQQRSTDALAGFKAVLALAPTREIALASSASLSAQTGDTAAAVGLWRRAVEVNPWEPEYRRSLAVLLARQGNWDEASVHCKAWRELNPLAVEAHRLWRDILLRQGRREEADAEQALLRVLQGP